MTTPSRNLMRSPKVRANLLASSLMPVNVWAPRQTPPPLSSLSRVNNWGDQTVLASEPVRGEPACCLWRRTLPDADRAPVHQRSPSYLPACSCRPSPWWCLQNRYSAEDRGRNVYSVVHLAEFYASFGRRCLQSNTGLMTAADVSERWACWFRCLYWWLAHFDVNNWWNDQLETTEILRNDAECWVQMCSNRVKHGFSVEAEWTVTFTYCIKTSAAMLISSTPWMISLQ